MADYHLPAYVNKNSLVILCSYSGNTEETLNLFEEAKAKECHILVLTAGGKLRQLAEENNLYINYIELGFQPRMALGYSLTYLILIFAELLKKDVRDELVETIASLQNSEPFKSDGERIFNTIKSKLKNKIVILTDNRMEAIGVRFTQQVQENAKHECFTHTLPEMTHNVIESYYGQLESNFIFLDAAENERVEARFEFLNGLLAVENNRVVNLGIDNFSIKKVYETIHRLDWLSLLIADARGVDSFNVPNIAQLKEFLENIQ